MVFQPSVWFAPLTGLWKPFMEKDSLDPSGQGLKALLRAGAFADTVKSLYNNRWGILAYEYLYQGHRPRNGRCYIEQAGTDQRRNE